mgnify:CR=1 FL=1
MLTTRFSTVKCKTVTVLSILLLYFCFYYIANVVFTPVP